MSLVTTTCPNCGIMFRVKPDQLAARHGQVRCGQCKLIFNGFATLAVTPDAPDDLASPDEVTHPGPDHPYQAPDWTRPSSAAPAMVDDRARVAERMAVALPDHPVPAARRDWTPPPPESEPAPDDRDVARGMDPDSRAERAARRAARAAGQAPSTADTTARVPTGSNLFGIRRSTPAAVPGRGTGGDDAVVEADVPPAPANPPASPAALAARRMLGMDSGRSRPPPAPASEAAAVPGPSSAASAPAPGAAPSLPERRVRSASSAPSSSRASPSAGKGTPHAGPLRPAMAPDRRLWRPGIAVLGGLTVLILMHLVSAPLARTMPSLRGPLSTACMLLGCDVPLPGDPDQMSIESSELRVDPKNPRAIVVQATLRNRARHAQAYPALELTLTDTQDHALVKHVLQPRDYLATGVDPRQGLAGNAEAEVRLQVEAEPDKAVGYRLYLFYP